MSFQYPQEIIDQQIVVRKELEKLAKMRVEYLKKTGQMPPSARIKQAAAAAASAPNTASLSPTAAQSEVVNS